MTDLQKTNEVDYALLSQIAEQSGTSQRALAEQLGISVAK